MVFVMDFAKLAPASAEALELRRDLHIHPELSGKEERTANLVACGRCASWDRTAWDALRAIPVCVATGEAAGRGAARAAKAG